MKIGALQSAVNKDSVFKDGFGLPWNQREALRTSNPSLTVIKIN